MTIHESWIVAFALASGGLLGAAYFGGLWWTVRRGAASTHPATLFFGSLGVRLGAALAGFYLISRLGALALVAGLLGFMLSRKTAIFFARSGPVPLEAGRAP
jgi:F1F0 ATPase subunit 2